MSKFESTPEREGWYAPLRSGEIELNFGAGCLITRTGVALSTGTDELIELMQR